MVFLAGKRRKGSILFEPLLSRDPVILLSVAHRDQHTVNSNLRTPEAGQIVPASFTPSNPVPCGPRSIRIEAERE
jgi:hypothetical protein